MRCLRDRVRTRFVPTALLIALAGFCSPSWGYSSDVESTSVIPVAKAVGQGNGARYSVDVLATGDSSRRQRDAAVSQLPFASLTPDAQREVQGVVQNMSLFRRLPTVEIDADRRCYEFFCARPDVAVSIWRTLDISNVQMWQTGAEDYEIDTGDGTIGTVKVLHRSEHSYLIVCRGEFQSPALRKPIKAVALMHLQPRFHKPGKVSHSVDLFVSLPSQTIETIAKLISPVSNRIADRNFEEVSLFVEMMNAGMAEQPGWVEQIARRLDGVLPTRPDELLRVTAEIYVEAERERLRRTGVPVSMESSLPMIPAIQQASMTTVSQ